MARSRNKKSAKNSKVIAAEGATERNDDLGQNAQSPDSLSVDNNDADCPAKLEKENKAISDVGENHNDSSSDNATQAQPKSWKLVWANKRMKPSRLYNAWAVWLLRIVVGAVFIISGISKSFDPWGFVFKIEEYLGVWGFDFSRSIVLVGAIALSVYEFVFGLMLAAGGLRRWAPRWLLLSMLVMLPLTGYILLNGDINDCGCFGDAYKISNEATFIKNIFLTIFLIYLCIYNRRAPGYVFAPYIQWIVGVISTIYIVFIALFGYLIQPLIDFRDYPEGLNLAEKVQSDYDNDDTEYEFKYERDGVERIFTADSLPDESWTFVERITPVNTDLDTSKLVIYDGEDDVTADVINPEGEQLLLIVPEPERIDASYSYYANELNSYLQKKGGDMIGLIGGGEKNIADWLDISMSEYPCYTVDDTTLKAMSRGTMSLIYLKDGIIQWKRSLSSIDFDTTKKIVHGEMSLDDLKIRYNLIFRIVTFTYLSVLAIIALFQHAIISLISIFRKKKQKNNVTLQTESVDNAGNENSD